MNTWLDRETMLDRFRQWLEEAGEEAASLPDEADLPPEPAGARPVGLLQLVEEFTALRHEVKLGTKSSRGLAEQTEQALAAVGQAVEAFRGIEAKEAEAGRLAAKPLVESLMELDEALGRGRTVIDTARRRILEDLAGRVQEELDGLLLRLPAWRRWLFRWWCRGAREILVQRTAMAHRDIFDSLLEGYGLMLSRLQRAMTKAELYRIQCVGKPADPNLMTVVEAVDDPLRPPGLVIDELRPGYYWKGKVIRFAEVRAVQSRTAH
ncbi:MAG: nucleotide exchange factor GrpE [Thermoguttaceae bacterium]|jgi:molecular chaperone GrpE